MHTRLEHLPNELLFNLFEYVDTRDLFNGFWRLNQRFNHLLQSLEKLSLTIEKNESKLISIFGCQIYRLVIDTCLDVDFTRFPYLHSLILHDVTETHLRQIDTQHMPYLIYISIPSNNTSWFVEQLIERIFSPTLSSLVSVNLPCPSESILSSCYSYSLQSISVSCTSSMMVLDILASCPNLSYLRVYFKENHYNFFRTLLLPFIKHPLRYFILLDPYSVLTYVHINTFLQCMPNLERIRLNFNCNISFIHLAQMISNQLPNLRQFNCHIDTASDDDMTSIETIQRIHPCFYRIQYITDYYGYRTYTTDKKE